MDTKEINYVLRRQKARFEFNHGKVSYFSISTQHGVADSIEKAINKILECDKKFEGKSGMRYLIEEFEKQLDIPRVDTKFKQLYEPVW